MFRQITLQSLNQDNNNNNRCEEVGSWILKVLEEVGMLSLLDLNKAKFIS